MKVHRGCASRPESLRPTCPADQPLPSGGRPCRYASRCFSASTVVLPPAATRLAALSAAECRAGRGNGAQVYAHCTQSSVHVRPRRSSAPVTRAEVASRLAAMSAEMADSFDSPMNRWASGDAVADQEVKTYRRQAVHFRDKARRLRHHYARTTVAPVRPRVIHIRTGPTRRTPRARRPVRRTRARSPGREPDRPHVASRGGRR